MPSSKNKFSKNIVPSDFTLSLALVDLFPVLFFGLGSIFFGLILKDITFIVGAVLCTLSGLIKVLWKFVVVLKKKNVWWMFLQMRIVMPISFILMLCGLIISIVTSNNFYNDVFKLFINIPTLIFYSLGVIGIICMVIFCIKLDSSSSKDNWIEQFTNGISQLLIFIGTLIAFLNK